MKTCSHCLWADVHAKTQIMIPREREALLSMRYLGKGDPRRVGSVTQEETVDQLATLSGKGRELASSRLQQAERMRQRDCSRGEGSVATVESTLYRLTRAFAWDLSEENLLSSERNLRKEVGNKLFKRTAQVGLTDTEKLLLRW